MRDVSATGLSVAKQLHKIVAPFLGSVIDYSLEVILSLCQSIDGQGSIEASTRVITKIRCRFPEQCEREIIGLKEYPTEASVDC